MAIAWVIGGNGLLGSALQSSLQQQGYDLFTPTERFTWNDASKLTEQLTQAVNEFSFAVSTADNWYIYWAAGVGTMSSSTDELATETITLAAVLTLLEGKNSLMTTTGSIAFASSAGAIYAGSKDRVINENSKAVPTTEYAKEKLKQEELLGNFSIRNDQVTVLLARISTLYGEGQANGKRQGLLAHIARCLLRQQAIHIYVPLDTIRDYITANDAAIAMIECLNRLQGKTGVYIKIIASETPTTIAEIISVFKRITRRNPRVVSSVSCLTGLYTRRVQFKSVTIPLNEKMLKTSLAVGISQVMAAERLSFTRHRK